MHEGAAHACTGGMPSGLRLALTAAVDTKFAQVCLIAQVSASAADSTACSTGVQQTLETARQGLGSLHTLAAMGSTGLLAALVEAGVQTQQNQVGWGCPLRTNMSYNRCCGAGTQS